MTEPDGKIRQEGKTMLEMLMQLTSNMWFMPMEKFSEVVYNAAEILPVIDAENCVEFGTTNGQELLIYTMHDDGKHIEYSCSIKEMFGKIVLENCYSKDGNLYEYDFDEIWDELSGENGWAI